MAKKNLYFRTVFKRENVLASNIFFIMMSLASYPRLLLEVFLRKNFGVRYFRFSSALTVAVLMILFPLMADLLPGLFRMRHLGSQQQGILSWLESYATWYIFTVAYMGAAFFRLREIIAAPSVFDFGKFSYYSGNINPLFIQASPLGHRLSIRQIECFAEPLVFLLLGLLLKLFGQPLGQLLVVSSIIYCLSYVGAYRRGDDFVMDLIDETLINENIVEAMTEDGAENKHGVRIYANKPNSKELRRKLAESTIEDDGEDSVVL